MTTLAVAAALGRVIATDTVPGLSALAVEIRHAHPADPEAETVARLPVPEIRGHG